MSEDTEKKKQENSTEEEAKSIPSQCKGQQLTSRNKIEKSVEEMVSEINAKRTRDQALLQNLKQDMDAWCRSAYASIEAAVYENTLKSGKVIDKKLTELFEALGRIRKIEEEMEQFRQQIGAFCVDVQ